MRLTFGAPCGLPYALPLRPVVVTPAGPIVRRTGFVMRLTSEAGAVGLGDVAPWPGFAGASAMLDNAQELAASWQAWAQRHLQGQHIEAPLGAEGPVSAARAAVQRFEALTAGAPTALRGAMQTAFLDLLAHVWQRPLAQLLAPVPASSVAVHALVDSAWAAQQACAQGYTALKIKVGRRQLSDELGTLCAIRSVVGSDVSLRLDANGAWPRHVAEQALKIFASVAPAWIEQPVAADDLPGLCALRALNIVPIAVDESVTDSASLHAVLDAGAADGVVLKPAFVGGALSAYALGRKVLDAGLSLCVTHALESSVGRMAALQVALALGATEACGLGGALQQDPVPAPDIHNGRLLAPEGIGLGVDHALWPAAKAPCPA